MRTLSIGRKFLSAALSAVVAAAALTFPAMQASAATTVTVGQKIAVDDKYTGYFADFGSSSDPVKTLTFYVTASSAGGFTYGMGIGTSTDPYWLELLNGKFVEGDGEGVEVTLEANKSTPIKIDLSKYSLSYNPKSGQYPGKFEFRNYYSGGTLKLDKIVANESSSTTTPTTPSTSTAEKSGAYTATDNNDGTYTLRTTLTGTVDELSALLTAGKDEESYLDDDGVSTWTEGDPINSRKMLYKDFGVPNSTDSTKVTIESFGFSVSSKTNMDTFMYGIGLNVEYKSPADTEYWLTHCDDPNTKKGYWYNEHGADEDGNPIDTSNVEIDDLCSIGEGTTLEDCGKWVDVTWDVPDDIKEYVTTQASDSVSFQFWYGDNKEDGYTQLKSVTLESATCTYTVEKTVPVSDLVDLTAGKTLTQGDDDTNTAHLKLHDADLAENDKIQAIIFKLTCPSEIKKLVFGITISDKASELQYTQLQYAILDAAKSQEIMIILPDTVSADTLYGDLGFGYYYGADKNDKLVNSIKLDKVTLLYDKAPEMTTTTTVTTTTTTTTTTTSTTPRTPTATKWGDVDANGTIDVSDAVLLARFNAEDQTAVVTSQGRTNADVTHDGTLGSDDITKILRHIALLIPYSDLEP